MAYFTRLAALAALCVALAGCTSRPDYSGLEIPYDSGRAEQPQRPASPLQCVPYAREQSGVQIFGDANLWWEKAAGRYARTGTPSEGAVMVLYNYSGSQHGHVAVVRDILDNRTIKVDHANWLNDGAIYTDNPVRDVSPDNDWSQVRVFNLRTGAWGGRIYPVQGFIGPGTDTGPRYDPNTDDMRLAATPHARDEIAALLAAEDAEDGQQTY